MHGLRIAFSPALGDLPVERSVAEVTERSVAVLAEIGCLVTREDPDLKGADEAFETLRALAFERDLGELADEHPQGLKQTSAGTSSRAGCCPARMSPAPRPAGHACSNAGTRS